MPKQLKRYYVRKSEGGGSLLDLDGKPLAKQDTWEVVDRHGPHGERVVFDVDSRQLARDECWHLSSTSATSTYPSASRWRPGRSVS